jgi:DNA-binding MarR family transcriptional regulator
MWLSDEEMAAWLPFVRVMLALPQSLDKQLRETTGVNHAHYSILAVLSAQSDRRLPMTELSRQAALSPSRLSHAVTGLEERGWVTRATGPGDRRMQYAQLTDAGLEELRAAAPGHVAEVRRLVFDQLTATDVADLRRIASKVAAALND